MSFTQPDLSDVLTNEQTMNSGLITCRNDLRGILTKEEIGYAEGDGVIPLIRKLPVPQLESMKMILYNMFSTGAAVSGTVTAFDTKGQRMANVPIKLYRVETVNYSTVATFLGDYTTDSNGEVSISVTMPQNKGMFYVQARSGNIICGEYGMYCTTAMNPNDFGYSSENNLFSSKGTGESSGFSIIEAVDDENYMELIIEAHSGYSGEYFGLLLPELGTYNKSSVQSHKAAILMNDMETGNKARWIGFGFVANPTDASDIAICGASKYYYGDGTGSTGKNFGLLIIDELNRRGFTTGTGNSRENKVDRARRVSADIQLNGIYLVGKDRAGFTKKWAMEFLEKITAYPNEAIHDDCVVAFTGGYEKIAIDNQVKRVDVDRWYSI